MNEKQFKRKFIKQLLEKLLQKYERSQAFKTGESSRVRTQLSFQTAPFHKDYYDEMDFRKQQWMNEVLHELEQRQVIALQWKKFREGQEVSKVYLEEQAVDCAYQIAGLTPKAEKLARMQHILTPLANHMWTWVRDWQQEMATALADRKSGGLKLEDEQGYADLVKVLLVLPEVEDNTPKRLLSQRLFADSKYFEQKVESRLLAILKKYEIQDLELERDEEVLDQVGIVQNPKLVRLSGSLRYEVNGRQIDLSTFPGGVGLSMETIQQMQGMQLPAARIITIENLTSYHQWIADPRNTENTLVIYTAGFPHRTVQQFLTKLAESFLSDPTATAMVYHWGDLDMGGIRIFEYIKQQFFSCLQPLYMDKETYIANVHKGMPIQAAYLKKVQAMLEQPRFNSWHPLLQLMMEQRVRIEQESIDPFE